MTFQIFYDKQPRKFLGKMDKHTAKRIIDKIQEVLPNDPVPHDAKSIVGKHGVFRIRVGGYRVLYRINYTENKIIIVEIDKRERIF